MLELTSKDNPKIKHIKKLASQSKYRKEKQQFILDSSRFTKDLIQKFPQQFHSIFMDESKIDHAIHQTIISSCKKNDISYYIVNATIFNTMSSVKNSQGCLSICYMPTYSTEIIESKSTICILDQLQNPSNIGSIIRSAAAFDIKAILLTENSADPFHPESIRAMAGNVFQVPILDCTPDLFNKVESEFTIYILDIAGQSISSKNRPQKKAFVFGSEGAGIKTDYIKKAKTEAIKIPISNSVDSLNVAVTAGITFQQTFSIPQIQAPTP